MGVFYFISSVFQKCSIGKFLQLQKTRWINMKNTLKTKLSKTFLNARFHRGRILPHFCKIFSREISPATEKSIQIWKRLWKLFFLKRALMGSVSCFIFSKIFSRGISPATEKSIPPFSYRYPPFHWNIRTFPIIMYFRKLWLRKKFIIKGGICS